MGIKIICTGPCRTGTKSFSAALRHFGYTVYEWEEHCFYHGKEWPEIIQHGHTKEMFQKMYADVDVVSDCPAFYFWEEILEAFPDAKIISMEREDETWYNSWVTVIDVWNKRPMTYQLQPYFSNTSMQFRTTLELNLLHCFGMISDSFSRPWNHVTSMDKPLIIKKYRDHLERVRQRAPKDPTKYLAYNITQGWEPLCKFLGLEVPDIPFPHLNKGGNMVTRMINNELSVQVNKECKNTISKYATVCVGLLVVGWYCYERNDQFEWIKNLIKF